MKIYFALFFTMLLSGFLNGVMDAINHGKGARPLKDLWHIAKYFFIFTLVIIGFLLSYTYWIYDLIVVPIGLIGKKFIWDACYCKREYWVKLDDKIKISTGIKWLDFLLGLEK